MKHPHKMSSLFRDTKSDVSFYCRRISAYTTIRPHGHEIKLRVWHFLIFFCILLTRRFFSLLYLVYFDETSTSQNLPLQNPGYMFIRSRINCFQPIKIISSHNKYTKNYQILHSLIKQTKMCVPDKLSFIPIIIFRMQSRSPPPFSAKTSLTDHPPVVLPNRGKPTTEKSIKSIRETSRTPKRTKKRSQKKLGRITAIKRSRAGRSGRSPPHRDIKSRGSSHLRGQRHFSCRKV